MRKRFFAASVIAAALGAMSLAIAAPGGGAQNTIYKSRSDYAYGSNSSTGLYSEFYANSWDDSMTGAPTGSVYVYWSDSINWYYISCSGPGFANAVSVHHGTGNTTVSAVLDPADPACYSSNVTAPVTLQLSGVADGNWRVSQNGTQMQTSGGTTWRSNFRSDGFSEVFGGTAPLFNNFSGSAFNSRSTDRRQVK